MYNKSMMCKQLSLAAVGLVCLAAPAIALPTPYGSPGTVNPVMYSFVATGTGPVTAYFVGQTAGFGSKVGMSVNGGPVAFSDFGLQNHLSAYGDAFVLGNATAGDILRFILAVDMAGGIGPIVEGDVDYYLNSDPTLNPGGDNHVFSSAYAGDLDIPAGTYVGFEDISPLSAPGNDLDYDDHQFVFVGVRGVPVPDGGGTVLLLGMALGGLGLLRRKL